MCSELFHICIKSSVIPPLKCVHMLSPCEMLPLALVIRIKSLSSLFTAQHLSYCSPELHAWLGFFFLFGFVKDLISFLFMCILTLAGAEKKKKITVPRCFEAAVAYIQLKLRRKTVADKTNFLIHSIAYLINLSCFIDKKTLKFHFRKTRIFYSCFLCPSAKSFLTSEDGPITPIFSFTNILL